MRTTLLALLCIFLAGGALAANPDTGYEFENDIMIQNAFGETVPGVRCATLDHGHPDLLRAPADLHAWAAQNGDKAVITIPVAFHVLYYWSNRLGGYIGEVTDQQIADQMDVLNAAYAPSGVQFTLFSVDRTENKQWASMRPGSGFEQEAKAALAVDPAHTLNIYTTYPSGGLLGWSWFPWSFEESHYMHGSVIHYGSLPGGYADPYNEGDTATHEIGHYLGLYHTFQGGCSEPNDYCDDTPQEQTATFRCPIGQDSCPDDPGLDPIFNFMDYTDDYCMIEFTGDQADRMLWAVTTYRPSLIGGKVRDDRPLVTASGPSITGVYPNPFNPMTEVHFSLDRSVAVNLSVYDVAGRLVKTLVDGTMPSGAHQVSLDGRGLSSGVYFTVLRAGDTLDRTRVMLLK